MADITPGYTFAAGETVTAPKLNALGAGGLLAGIKQIVKGPDIAKTSFVVDYWNTLPFDDTVPTDTEGREIWTASITPTDVGNRVLLSVALHIACAADATVAFTVFRGSTCIAVRMVEWTSTGGVMHVKIEVLDEPATALPVTYSVRCGTTATLGINNYYSGGLFDDLMADGQSNLLVELIA